MAADILASEMNSRLRLQSKTIGADRIKKAKDNNEDVAVLSMFLPLASAKEENKRFRCALGSECFLGDCTKTVAGGYYEINIVTINGPIRIFSLATEGPLRHHPGSPDSHSDIFADCDLVVNFTVSVVYLKYGQVAGESCTREG